MDHMTQNRKDIYRPLVHRFVRDLITAGRRAGIDTTDAEIAYIKVMQKCS